MNDSIILFIGVICAGVGGELFVRGAVGLAHWARISPGIIGATVAAFATSSPELSVAVNASLAGQPQITLGDALGSNVVNVSMILAIALIISGIQSPRDSLKRDFPVALMVPVLTAVLLLDGMLSRFDGFLMMACFLVWLATAVMEARRQRSLAEDILGAHRGWVAVIWCLVGLGLLVAAGSFIVTGARGIAVALGMNAFVIGATIVAVGTSVPELATTVIAKLRGHDEVGLGTILGSNIFNGLFIISVAAIIHPITVGWRELIVTLSVGFVALIFAYPPRGGFIGRWRGVLLLVLYTAYIVVILQHKSA